MFVWTHSQVHCRCQAIELYACWQFISTIQKYPVWFQTGLIKECNCLSQYVWQTGDELTAGCKMQESKHQGWLAMLENYITEKQEAGWSSTFCWAAGNLSEVACWWKEAYEGPAGLWQSCPALGSSKEGRCEPNLLWCTICLMACDALCHTMLHHVGRLL